MSVQCRINFSVIFFFIVITTSSGQFNILQKYQKDTLSENSNTKLINNCVKDIIQAERMRNVLIVGRAEHFHDFDMSIIGNITRMKIYKRIGGWIKFESMLQFKRMSYVVLVERYYQFEESIRQFQRYRVFNSRLQFILLPLHYPSQIEIEKYGKLLIATRIINYLILLRNSTTSTVKLITNFPYKHRMCGHYSPGNDILIATYHQNGSFDYSSNKLDPKHFYDEDLNSKLFPAKVPRDLKKCEIRIVTGLWPPNVIDVNRAKYPGIETEFTRDIARHMNFVPKYLFIDSIVGDKLPNKTWTGFMGYLQRNEVDMAIGAVHVDPERLYYFDVSEWYLYNYMLWIVPLMKPLSKSAVFEHFLIESSLLSKALFISIFLSTTIVMLSAAKLVDSKDSQHYSKIGYICMTLFRMFLSQPHNKVPNTVQLRRIFASWLGFCTFIIFFFQTSITSYFMASGKAVQLQDIQQAFKLNLRITYDSYYDHYVKNSSPDFDVSERNEKFPVIPSLNLVAKGEAVTFIDRLRAIYITKQWLREDGSIPIRLLFSEPVHRYWVQSVMTKGHFLSPWINELVGRSWSSGFWAFKQNEYIERRTIQCSVRRQIILNNDIKGLNNTKAVARYNDAIYEAFPTEDPNGQVNIIFAPTNASEEDLLDMFRVSIDTKISFRHIEAVFELYIIGMILAIVAFVYETLELRVKNFIQMKLNGKKRNT